MPELIQPPSHVATEPGELIAIVGDTGTGKTSSARNLPPSSTYIIGGWKKKLPFLGAASKFSIARGNLEYTNAMMTVVQRMRKPPMGDDLRHLVLDDCYFLMMEEFSNKFGTKLSKDGVFAMYREMALSQWGFYKVASQIPAPIKTFVMLHDEETITGKIQVKTIGAMTENRINPPSLFSYVLYAERIFHDEKVEYVFMTQTDGMTPAKSPVDLFPPIIHNDLWLVSQRLDEYYIDGIELKDSKLDFGNFSLSRTQEMGIKNQREALLRETGRLRTPPKRSVKVKDDT